MIVVIQQQKIEHTASFVALDQAVNWVRRLPYTAVGNGNSALLLHLRQKEHGCLVFSYFHHHRCCC